MNRRPLGPQPSALPDCATSRRVVCSLDNTRLTPCYHKNSVSQAAYYIRTDHEGELPSKEEQLVSIEAYASAGGHELVANYEDLDAPGTLLYYRPGIKAAINNIKEEEDWEVLIVADLRAISDTESARHEFVHKFSLYNNRVECPGREWEDILSDMKAYRRAMSRR